MAPAAAGPLRFVLRRIAVRVSRSRHPPQVDQYYSNSMPKRRTASAKTPKQMTVMMTQTSRVGQKPRRGSSAGNARNIGNVGTTYQNVYQAWFAIFSGGCFST